MTKIKVKSKSLVRLIGIGLLIFILLKIDWSMLNESLKDIQWRNFLHSILLLFPLYIFKSLRWKYLLSIQRITYSLKDAFLAFLSSNYIAFITPGRIGEVAKAFYVKNDLKISFAKSMPAVIIDRLFDVYILLAVGTIGLMNYLTTDDIGISFWIVAVLIILLPLLLLWRVLVLKILKLTRLANLRISNHTIYEFMDSFYSEIRTIISPKLIIGLVLTLVAYLSLYYSGFQLIQAINVKIDFITIAIFISIANILSFIPISISGLGTREASLIYLFSLIGSPKEEALLFSFLLFFVFFIIGGLLGFICYMLKPIEIKKLKFERK